MNLSITAPQTRKLAGVVLASVNYGEADLIATFLTGELGLVSALARYGRRSRRRFGGGLLAPGAMAWYDFTLKPESTLAFVEKAEENPRVRRLPPDPVIQALAAFALELVRGFEAPRNPAPASFSLLAGHLSRLALIPDEETARRAALNFSIKYLELAGYGPALNACLACGVPAQAGALGWRWHSASGGLYCPRCPGSGRLVPRGFLARPGEPAAPPEPDELTEAEAFFEELAAHQLGRPLKALGIARRLFKASRSSVFTKGMEETV
ncbi:MAG: DNA repair protein RecO [Deltaproteobacteria bacterium]|nr:DNA repair protein RecO [Deltaproteobacteria bacterium]